MSGLAGAYESELQQGNGVPPEGIWLPYDEDNGELWVPYDAAPGEVADPGIVQRVFQNGIEQQNHVTLGEDRLKEATMVAWMTGKEVAIVGLPGANKSEHTLAVPRLVDNIGKDKVAWIPAAADLKPSDVVGGVSEIDKELGQDGDVVSTETVRSRKKGLVRPESIVLAVDEGTRVGPHALNQALEIWRDRHVITKEGIVYFPNLEVAVINFNPTENTQMTFPIPDALASRNALGVVPGLRNRDTLENILRGFEPTPERIKPVATLAGMHAVRRYINSGRISYPETLVKTGADLIENSNNILQKQFMFWETDFRGGRQLRRGSIALAAGRGKAHVEEQDVRDTMNFMLTARLGMVGIRGTELRVVEVPRLVDEILDQAA